MVNRIKNFARKFNEDNRGAGVIEMVLIIVVILGLVVIFRDQLTTIIQGIFQRIVNESSAI